MRESRAHFTAWSSMESTRQTRTGQPEFHELPPPEDADVVRVAALVAERVESLLKRRGLGPGDDPDTAEALAGTSRFGRHLFRFHPRQNRVGSPRRKSLMTVGARLTGTTSTTTGSRCAMLVSDCSVHARSIDAPID